MRLKEGINTQPVPVKTDNYINPFAVDDNDSINLEDKVGLYEYSLQTDRSISAVSSPSESTNQLKEFNLKEYDNFVLKVEELKLLDYKQSAALNGNIIYIECKVPILSNEAGEIYHDTYKYLTNKSF